MLDKCKLLQCSIFDFSASLLEARQDASVFTASVTDRFLTGGTDLIFNVVRKSPRQTLECNNTDSIKPER